MKKLMYVTVLFLAACNTKSEDKPMGPRKAAIVQSKIYDFYDVHFDIKTPPAHPEKIEELVIKKSNGSIDTIHREYFFEKDKLVKVTENESGTSVSVTFLKYDNEGRCILIDEQTPKGSIRKHTIEYKKEAEPYNYQVITSYFVDNKLEEKNSFKYLGNTDHFSVSLGSEGYESYDLRETNDTTFVENIWHTSKDEVMDHKIIAYDKNARIGSITTMEKEAVDRVVRFTYDKYGNELSRIEEDVDNVVGGSAGITAISSPSALRSQYVYDTQGNYTSKTMKNASGSFLEVTTRKIIYAK
jgi:YD repeat-containing protein